MTAPERFADGQIPLAPRAPSIHGPLRRLAAMQQVSAWLVAWPLRPPCAKPYAATLRKNSSTSARSSVAADSTAADAANTVRAEPWVRWRRRLGHRAP